MHLKLTSKAHIIRAGQDDLISSITFFFS